MVDLLSSCASRKLMMRSSGAAVYWTCCAPARDAGGLGRITGKHGKAGLWGSQFRDWLYCLNDGYTWIYYYTIPCDMLNPGVLISSSGLFSRCLGPLKPWKVLNSSISQLLSSLLHFHKQEQHFDSKDHAEVSSIWLLGHFSKRSRWGADAGGWRKCWSDVQGPQHWGALKARRRSGDFCWDFLWL